MKELVDLSKQLNSLQGKMKILEDGYIPINHKKFQSVLKITLKDLFRDEEKINLLRDIKVLGIAFGIVIVLLISFEIFLILFTVPIE